MSNNYLRDTLVDINNGISELEGDIRRLKSAVESVIEFANSGDADLEPEMACCRSCGSESDLMGFGNANFVGCSNQGCRVSGPVKGTKAAAIRAWNELQGVR